MAPRKLPPGEKHLHVSVALLPQHWDDLRAMARLRDQSASALARRAIEEFIAREKTQANRSPAEREAVAV